MALAMRDDTADEEFWQRAIETLREAHEIRRCSARRRSPWGNVAPARPASDATTARNARIIEAEESGS
jgi:uncharacterized membrane protein (UPF0182 family)